MGTQPQSVGPMYPERNQQNGAGSWTPSWWLLWSCLFVGTNPTIYGAPEVTELRVDSGETESAFPPRYLTSPHLPQHRSHSTARSPLLPPQPLQSTAHPTPVLLQPCLEQGHSLSCLHQGSTPPLASISLLEGKPSCSHPPPCPLSLPADGTFQV